MFSDRLILEFDHALRTVFGQARSDRSVPGCNQPEKVFDEEERKRVIGLMRVNHSGEVCAQALYQGQALLSRDGEVAKALQRAAREETEHLAWTEHRIAELGGRRSLLNPLWYVGSLSIGILAGALGDRWSLGFLRETERQVEGHLNGHLALLPTDDERSREIIAQMKDDEVSHAHLAEQLGAADLPPPVTLLMRKVAKVMTGLAYRC